MFDRVTADISFAPGHAAARTWTLDFLPRETDTEITTSHLRSWVAQNAICTWADAWVAADDAGNRSARTTAARTLAASLSWEPVRTFDADHGEPAPQNSGPGQSYYGWLRPLAATAGSGDRQGVLDAVAAGHLCAPAVLPVLSADPNYPGAR